MNADEGSAGARSLFEADDLDLEPAVARASTRGSGTGARRAPRRGRRRAAALPRARASRAGPRRRPRRGTSSRRGRTARSCGRVRTPSRASCGPWRRAGRTPAARGAPSPRDGAVRDRADGARTRGRLRRKDPRRARASVSPSHASCSAHTSAPSCASFESRNTSPRGPYASDLQRRPPRAGNLSKKFRRAGPSRSQYSWFPRIGWTGTPASRSGARSASTRAQSRADEPWKTRSPRATTKSGARAAISATRERLSSGFDSRQNSRRDVRWRSPRTAKRPLRTSITRSPTSRRRSAGSSVMIPSTPSAASSRSRSSSFTVQTTRTRRAPAAVPGRPVRPRTGNRPTSAGPFPWPRAGTRTGGRRGGRRAARSRP